MKSKHVNTRKQKNEIEDWLDLNDCTTGRYVVSEGERKYFELKEKPLAEVKKVIAKFGPVTDERSKDIWG